MDDQQFLAEQFEQHRTHLRAVAYRMLGSITEADDAVQEAWLRLSRSDADAIENLAGWLTTVVSRVCLNVLRSRTARREDLLDPHLPDPIVTVEGTLDPEEEVMLADAVGVALLVVLETLTPAERLAFVLHDTFAVPFDQVAEVLGRSPEATRQLASRARRRVRGATAPPDADVARQRAVVDAFFAAARAGDFEGLVALLDPDVVARSDGGPRRAQLSFLTSGAAAVAGQALTYANPAADVHPALVNGAAGVVVTLGGHPQAIMGFTVVDGRIVAINALVDPDRIAELDLAAFTG
jgi:RNA polymerase sigma-70 factor (ECF subfamily)